MNPKADETVGENAQVIATLATLVEKVNNLEKRLDRGDSKWPVILSALAVVISVASKVPWISGG